MPRTHLFDDKINSDGTTVHDNRYCWKHYGLITGIKAAIFFPYYRFMSRVIGPSEGSVVQTESGELTTIPNDLGISKELRIFKVHEPLVTKILKHELKEGMICLDIGANLGYYAILERKIAGPGRVITIEPSPRNVSCLKQNLSLNRFLDVSVFTLALSDADREVDFLMADESNACRVVEGGGPPAHVIKVEAKTLDTFLEENRIDSFDFLRMDVEGHELAIYNGGREAIRRIRPNLLIEIHERLLGNNTLDLLLKIREDGYEVEYLVPREIDYAWIGSEGHVQRLSISELISRVRARRTPDVYHLFLKNKHQHTKELSGSQEIAGGPSIAVAKVVM